jgi:hypothetical protein
LRYGAAGKASMTVAPVFRSAWDDREKDSADPGGVQWPQPVALPGPGLQLAWSTGMTLPTGVLIQVFDEETTASGEPSGEPLASFDCSDVRTMSCPGFSVVDGSLVWEGSIPRRAAHVSIWASWSLPSEAGDEDEMAVTWLAAVTIDQD